MPTRRNRGFYRSSYCLLNMFRAPLCPYIRSSRVLYSGCCLWYFVLWFSSCWSGVELRVMWKTTAQNTTGSNHCIILLSSWWWAYWCPKHVEKTIRSAIKTSVHLVGILFFTEDFDLRGREWHNDGEYCKMMNLIISIFHQILLFITPTQFTMFVGYLMKQLFCGYNLWYMQRNFPL